MRFKQATHPWSAVRRVFGKRFAGSTGDSPVPSGDSPDGTGATVRGNRLFATLLAAVPVGGSPARGGYDFRSAEFISPACSTDRIGAAGRLQLPVSAQRVLKNGSRR